MRQNPQPLKDRNSLDSAMLEDRMKPTNRCSGPIKETFCNSQVAPHSTLQSSSETNYLPCVLTRPSQAS